MAVAKAEAAAAARIAEAQAQAERDRIAAAEKERERQRIAAEQKARAEQAQRQFLAERKAKWSRVYDTIEKDIDSDNVVALVNNGIDENDTKFYGGSSIMSNKPLSRTGKLEWQSKDERLSIGVYLREGVVTSKNKQGF